MLEGKGTVALAEAAKTGATVELNRTELDARGADEVVYADGSALMASAVTAEELALELAPKVIWTIEVEVKVVCEALSDEAADKSEALTAGTIEALPDEAGSTRTAVEWLE